VLHGDEGRNKTNFKMRIINNSVTQEVQIMKPLVCNLLYSLVIWPHLGPQYFVVEHPEILKFLSVGRL
jgi:hypothetical protein